MSQTARGRAAWVARAIAVAFVGFWVVGGLSSLTGFDVDGDTFEVRVQNDTPETVYLSYCKDGSCAALSTPRELKSSDGFSFNAVASDEVLDGYLVQDDQGTVIGCIMFTFDRPHPGLTVDVSEATPCPPGHGQLAAPRATGAGAGRYKTGVTIELTARHILRVLPADATVSYEGCSPCSA